MNKIKSARELVTNPHEYENFEPFYAEIEQASVIFISVQPTNWLVGYVKVPADFILKLGIKTEKPRYTYNELSVDYTDPALSGYVANELTYGELAKNGEAVFGIDDNHLRQKGEIAFKEDLEELAKFLKAKYEEED